MQLLPREVKFTFPAHNWAPCELQLRLFLPLIPERTKQCSMHIVLGSLPAIMLHSFYLSFCSNFSDSYSSFHHLADECAEIANPGSHIWEVGGPPLEHSSLDFLSPPLAECPSEMPPCHFVWTPVVVFSTLYRNCLFLLSPVPN